MGDQDTSGAPRPIEEQAPWIAQVPKEKRGEDLLSLGTNLGDVVDHARAIIKERDELKAASKPKEGVPSSPEGYKFTFPQDYPKDLVNDTDLKAFASIAHRLKLTPAEAADLVNFETGRNIAGRKAFTEARAAMKKKAEEEFINEFKEKSDERLAQGLAVVDQFGDAELKKEMLDLGFWSNPRLGKMLIKIGSLFTEKGLMNTAGTGAGPAAAQEGVDLKEVYKRSYATGAMK